MRAVQAHKRGQFVMWGYAPHAQTYQRGGVLFEITSGGSFPHSGLKTTLPLVYHETSSKKGGSVTVWAAQTHKRG